ncbi:MAG TPA: formate dehydrogenase accessory sulfurtransferase FdhD, partial [Saprospiraceae bacterium]|nr:formate dehydrogenase accessory sulfurtransferase FdhD [Saprospiraceae bacterium]
MTPTIKQIPFGKTIVVAPLNWGLGHASRCIPLINQALSQNNKVIIASDGIALNLLRKEFPKLKFYELPAYDIKYPFSFILFNLIWQSPKIWMAIQAEKKTISITMRTPGNDEELASGFLFTEGIIKDNNSIESFSKGMNT